MAEFADIAAHFDDVPVADGYSGVELFKAQFNTFDESSPDGSVVSKRTMSCRPTIMPPPRRVILVSGDRWVVGEGNTDAFQGVPVRRAYWTKKVTDFATIQTPQQAVLGVGGYTAYVHRKYMKDTVNSATDGQYDPFWEFSYSPSESMRKGWFITIGDDLYRIRTRHLDLNGLMAAQADELDFGARVTVDLLANTTRDPVTEQLVGTAEQHPGIFFDMYKMYNLKTDDDPKMHSGDKTLLLDENVRVKVGGYVTVEGERYLIQTRAKTEGVWQCHLRMQ